MSQGNRKSSINPLIMVLAVYGGARPEVLKRAPSQASNFASTGMGILFITIIGGVSGGYAIWTIIEKPIISYLGGTSIGLMLGYLDRVTVATISKPKKPTRSERFINSTLIVVKMAVTIAISSVITMPMVVRIFEKPITVELAELNREKVQEYRSEIDREKEQEENELRQAFETAEANVEAEENRLNDKQEDIDREVTVGNPLFGRGPGRGDITETLIDQKGEIEDELERKRDILDTAKQNLRDFQREIDNEVEAYKQELEDSTDIFTKLEAFNQLTKDEDPFFTFLFISIGYFGATQIALNLLFIALDGTSIISRFLEARNDYDKAKDDIEEETRYNSEKRKQINKTVSEQKLTNSLERQQQRLKEQKEEDQQEHEARLSYFKNKDNFDSEILSQQRNYEKDRRKQKLDAKKEYTEKALQYKKQLESESLLILKNKFEEKLRSCESTSKEDTVEQIKKILQEIEEMFAEKERKLGYESNQEGKADKAVEERELGGVGTINRRRTRISFGVGLGNLTHNISAQFTKLRAKTPGMVDWIRRLGEKKIGNNISVRNKALLLGGLTPLCLSFTYLTIESIIVSRKYDIRYIPYPQTINSPAIYDIEGTLIQDRAAMALYPEQDIDNFSEYLIDSIIASEDRRFYEHNGVDWRGLGRALIQTVLGNRQGASTLSQQVVKKLFIENNPSGESEYKSSLRRKIHQMILAIKFEGRYGKEKILETYLNRIYIGNEVYLETNKGRKEINGIPYTSIYGFEEASQLYFDKPASQLRIEEAALLVTFLPEPNNLLVRPSNNDAQFCQDYIKNEIIKLDECFPAAKEQRNKRIEQLLELQKISDEEAIAAKEKPILLSLSIREQPRYSEYQNTASDFQEIVEKELDSILREMGKNSDRHYVVETTLDMRLQKQAQEAIDQYIANQGLRKGLKYASIATLDQQGGILALAYGTQRSNLGGHIQFNSNYATYSKNRRLASTFKLFPLIAAVDKNFVANDTFNCPPKDLVPASSTFEASCSDLPLSLEEAIAQSNNAIPWLLSEEVGREPILKIAENLGISGLIQEYENSMQQDLLIPLGLVRSNLLDITNAYSTIAKDGLYTTPHSITIIRDPHECEDESKITSCKIIYDRSARGESPQQVIDRDVAIKVQEILKSVVTSEKGTARMLRVEPYNFGDIQIGGKTGTETNGVDSWFVGTAYNQGVTTGVWLGSCPNEGVPYDNDKCNLPSSVSSRDAVFLWGSFMQSALNKL